MGDNNVNDQWLETYKSLVSLATEGFKFSTLINGGAAVAILAYLGNLSEKDKPIPDMRWAMGCFLIGLGFCGLSILFSYFTQLKRLNDIAFGRNPSSSKWRLFCAIITFELSIIAFIAGSLVAVLSFK